ncbi:MAG: hypothetical protein HS116_25415 [Planctomycetes bacterium]|nr:hypothetical protein [Planctomycetota bacterium]
MAKLYPKNDGPVQVETARTARQPKHPSPGKSLGLASFVKGMLSGQVSPEIREARIAICRACTATDSKGERLFREIGGRMYCGEPKLQKLLRVDARDGCGCNLSLKIEYKNATCPHNKW